MVSGIWYLIFHIWISGYLDFWISGYVNIPVPRSLGAFLIVGCSRNNMFLDFLFSLCDFWIPRNETKQTLKPPKCRHSPSEQRKAISSPGRVHNSNSWWLNQTQHPFCSNQLLVVYGLIELDVEPSRLSNYWQMRLTCSIYITEEKAMRSAVSQWPSSLIVVAASSSFALVIRYSITFSPHQMVVVDF